VRKKKKPSLLKNFNQMDYFNDVFTTFLGHEICNDFAAYGWFRNLSDLIKDILMNESLMCLERHKGE